jgi:penicillin-binding protein 1C
MTWGLLSIVLLLVVSWFALRLVPLPQSLLSGELSETEFVDRNGQPLRAVRSQGSPFGRTASYAEIPLPLIEATLAAEDRRFWSHHGVDCRATLRALRQLAWHRRVVSGGSTITQQLIKLAEPRPRTIRTKIIEAFQALRLEQVWSKQRILAEYLNRLDYGNFNHGAAGAAEYYFAKPLRDLTPAECALLASLPQAPSRLNPYGHLDRACKRQQLVLSRMHTAGWLTGDELGRALAEPISLVKPRRVFEAPHFVDLIMCEMQGTASSGHVIRTSLDLELNRFAEDVLHEHLATVQAQHVSNGALVIIDNRTGEVLTMVGSENYFSTNAGQVNDAWAPRSPGSTLKPFTYLLAMERGATPATVVADVPTEFVTSTGLFAPVNYNRHCYGPVRYRVALANSLNISAVKVLESIGGPEPLQRLLQQCGLSTLDHSPNEYGLGLTIGNADVRLLELANAYAALARLGAYQPYRLLAKSMHENPAPSRQVADASVAYLIADILSDNDARAVAFGADSALRFDFPVACKTGTSSDFRDNWAFGYTPEFTVGVWIGNADGSPMEHVSGVTGAAPILHELFEYLHERYGTTWYSQPANILECWIQPVTGKRLKNSEQAAGLNAVKEKFLAYNLPSLESSSDYEMISPSKYAVRLGNEYRDWFASGDNWLGDAVVLRRTESALRILFPPPGTIFYLDADLPDQGRRLCLRASSPANVEWHSDSLSLTNVGHREVALLTEGRHELSAHDRVSGAEADTWIDVRAR